MQCGPIVHRRFEDMYHLHLKRRRVFKVRIEQEVGDYRIVGGLLPKFRTWQDDPEAHVLRSHGCENIKSDNNYFLYVWLSS